MAEYLRVARLYLLLLAIFTVGRWIQGVAGTPYERGHQVFSIVTLTILSSVYYGAFCRRWRGYRLFQAAVLGLLLGLMSQVVIFTATVLSYTLDIDTYFRAPRALNVEVPIALGPAVVIRLGGLVTNSVSTSIIGMLGWAMGGLLPDDKPVKPSGKA
jgi:hypothetical protein